MCFTATKKKEAQGSNSVFFIQACTLSENGWDTCLPDVKPKHCTAPPLHVHTGIFIIFWNPTLYSSFSWLPIV